MQTKQNTICTIFEFLNLHQILGKFVELKVMGFNDLSDQKTVRLEAPLSRFKIKNIV